MTTLDEAEVRAPRHARAGWRPDPATVVLGSLLLINVILRVLILTTDWVQPDSDEATGMILALRASQGHLALLFPGQAYGGALLSWLEAPLIALFGLHIGLFWLVDTVCVLVMILVLWRLALRLLPPVAAAAVAGAFGLFPPAWLYWTTREFVFYVPAVTFALAAALCALRWFEGGDRRYALGLGLFAGLSTWSYPGAVALWLPAAAVFAWAERRRPANVARAAIAGVAGVGPWIAYFAIHGTGAYHSQAVGESKLATARHTITQVLAGALTVIPKRVGLIWSLDTPGHKVLVAAGVLAYLFAVASTAVFVARRQVALAACGAAVVIWPVVMVVGHVPMPVSGYRYGFLVVAPLLVLAGYWVSRLRASLVLAAGAVVYAAAATWSGTYHFASAPHCNPGLVTTGHYLESHGRTAVWGSYWLAADLMVCSDHLTVAPAAFDRDGLSRREALAAPRSTYVVFAGQGLDQQIRALTSAEGFPVRRAVIGGYAIWLFDGRTTPVDLQLSGVF